MVKEIISGEKQQKIKPVKKKKKKKKKCGIYQAIKGKNVKTGTRPSIYCNKTSLTPQKMIV